LDAFFTDIAGSFSSNPIIGFPGSAIQAETEKVHFLGTDLGKDIMKQDVKKRLEASLEKATVLLAVIFFQLIV
jgi:hypothetical protein